MQFHHHGYVSGDPRIAPAGVERSADLPDEMDVLIVGSGPAGMLLAAQLAQFPTVSVRLIEKRAGRLAIGQADGIQARSVETFQAFGFAERIVQEAYRITEMNVWSPGAVGGIERTQRTLDDAHGVSEFPHLIVNQARVLDYFAEVARTAAGRVEPDYGWEFVTLTVGEGEYPVSVTLRAADGAERTVRARYVVGCDGARSRVREAIGARHQGAQAKHAWGVMDALAVTDFPDIRTKCVIQSHAGSILLIPREGGHLFRMYVDLGETGEADAGAVRQTPLEEIVARANAILTPYTLDVRDVPWWSVYEVGHRVTDRFDDVEPGSGRDPHVFICGDACHTHSAKAGQGMNVSMQDGFNLGWKLAAVLTGQSRAAVLATYSAERQPVAEDLIAFDREWSSLVAKKPEEFSSPSELGDFYTETAEFPAGFRTEYPPALLVADAAHQELATGFPIGKRFRSAPVVRVADTNPVQLGHQARADGRWRLYVFADAAAPGERSAVDELAEWLADYPASPVVRFTPAGSDLDAVFDARVIYQQGHHDFDVSVVPGLFLPASGPLGLTDYEKVFAAASAPADIFDERGIARSGALVVVRPDQYVAGVFPLEARDELAAFFDRFLLPHADRASVSGFRPSRARG